ncbi:MAG: hypothetical protein U0X34_02905 [Bacteroidia bacterium]
MTGKVCTARYPPEVEEKLCKHYGLTLETVKIGFKYICEIMVREDVLIGRRERRDCHQRSYPGARWNLDGIGDLGIHGRKRGKTCRNLSEEVYDIVGPFSFERNDLP